VTAPVLVEAWCACGHRRGAHLVNSAGDVGPCVGVTQWEPGIRKNYISCACPQYQPEMRGVDEATGLTRSKRTITRDNGKPEHYWLLSGPDGVLSFCTIECSDPFAHAHVDGVPWMSWGVDAHIPAAQHASSDPEHVHDVGREWGCGLLDDTPCCVVATPHWIGRGLLNRWIAGGHDDDIVWSELDARYADMVTANVQGTPEIERGCTQ
jgi:hypothetical protein